MHMRSCQSADLTAVMNIANMAWRPIRQMGRDALGDRINAVVHPAGEAASKGREVRDQIESGDYEVLICEHEDRIVGFITFRVVGAIGEICNNAALPDSGVKGVGQTMYRTVLETFRSRGVKVARVTTGLDWAHAPARRAYERAGFHKHLDFTTYYMDLETEFE